MSLSSGNYSIFSTARNAFLGSLLLAPQGDYYPVQPLPSTQVEPPKWSIIPGTVADRYTVKFQGKYDLVTKENLVWVSNDPSAVKPVEWTIGNSPRDGPNVFVVSGPHQDSGRSGIWMIPPNDDPHGQITSQTQLATLPVWPPVWPDTVKFEINKLD